MKKKLTLLLLPALLLPLFNQAQCTIDYSQITPGVYPDTLMVATANHPYSQDVTFVLITDTLGLTIYNFQIANIVGLPAGMNWQCNNFANGCNYNPAVSLYGCVNLGGTPLLPGTYTATVTVIADVQIVGNQTIQYSLPLIVAPDTVSNPGFSMTNSSGCAPLTVSFTNNNPGQSSYLWDFGNGLQSNLENPPQQTYNLPGTYVVTQTVTPNGNPQYFLTSVDITSIPDNYGAPIDVPDMYFYIYDPMGNQIYDSHPSISNTNPPYSWTLPNIPLQNGNYTLHAWDEDGGLFGADDDLGSVSFPGWSTSGTATGFLPGVSGALNVNYHILVIPVNPVTATDTVHVYPSPTQPLISASGPVDFCEGDSVILTSSAPNNNQWFDNNTILPGDTFPSITVFSSGLFSVVVSNSYGCTAGSAYTQVTVNPIPPKPTFFVNGNTLNCVLTGYMLQWYLNGIPMPGETSPVLNVISGGTFTITATDSITGCTNISDPLFFSPVSAALTASTPFHFDFSPNPGNGWIEIRTSTPVNFESKIVVRELSGKEVYAASFTVQAGISSKPLNLQHLAAGIYFLSMKTRFAEKICKLVIVH